MRIGSPVNTNVEISVSTAADYTLCNYGKKVIEAFNLNKVT
jgi:hypothetical protein